MLKSKCCGAELINAEGHNGYYFCSKCSRFCDGCLALGDIVEIPDTLIPSESVKGFEKLMKEEGYDEIEEADWKEEFRKNYDFSENTTLEYDNLITIETFIENLLKKEREKIKEEEIKYWKNIFNNKPNGRSLESDTIAQNFSRIEIERWENKI